MSSRNQSRLRESEETTEKRHRRAAEVLADVDEVFGTSGTLKPFSSKKEFQEELQEVMERDYGVALVGVQLDEAAANINQYLRAFL